MAFISKRKKLRILTVLLAEVTKDLMIYRYHYGDLTEEQIKDFEENKKEKNACLIKDLAK